MNLQIISLKLDEGAIRILVSNDSLAPADALTLDGLQFCLQPPAQPIEESFLLLLFSRYKLRAKMSKRHLFVMALQPVRTDFVLGILRTFWPRLDQIILRKTTTMDQEYEWKKQWTRSLESRIRGNHRPHQPAARLSCTNLSALKVV